MRYHRERRGVSEIVGILVMVAVVVSLGVLVFGLSSSGMDSLSQGYATAMTGKANARSEAFTVEQVAFTISGTLPITLTNNQGSATPTTFQQQITWNPSSYSYYEASDLGNIQFCADSACATTLSAWLESCTTTCTPSATSATAWVKLTSSIAGSGGTLTIYMGFQPIATEFDTNKWGEAPNLSPSYGQFDNGANVFNFYDNFAGSSLSNKWTTVKSAGGSVTVNNGAYFGTSGGADYAYVVSAVQAYPSVAESNLVSATGSTVPTLGVVTCGSSCTTANYNGIALQPGYNLEESAGVLYLLSEIATTPFYTIVSSGAESLHTGIWKFIWATGAESASDGVLTLSGASGAPAIANYGVYIGQSAAASGTDLMSWSRMRALPPGTFPGVMPSTGLGSVTSTSGADVYVRNGGAVQTTLVSVYIMDLTKSAFVLQATMSTTVNVASFVEIPHSTLTFTFSHGDTYSFTVTSSLGDSVIYNGRAA